MKIGVMSDTHGHLDVMRNVANRMISEYSVDAIIHLGDDSTDAEKLSTLSIDLYWVPGTFEERYKDPQIPNRLIKEFEDIPVLITHTPTADSHDLEGDINPTEAIEDGDVKVMLHGHTHAPRIVEEKGVFVINPGHLNAKDSKGRPLSFAVLDLTSRKLHTKILAIDGSLLEEKTFFFEV